MLRYMLAVFIGSCSYGVLSTIVKLAYQAGAKTSVVTVGQFLIGWFILFVCYFFSRRKEKISYQDKGKLMLAGIPTGLVGVFYYLALVKVEASLGIILLFQFVWIGIVLDYLFFKRTPDKGKAMSVMILFVGTLMASGIIHGGLIGADLIGIVYGLLAAVSFSLFIFTNASILPALPPVQRSYYMVTGSTLAVLVIFLPSLMNLNGGDSLLSLGTYGIMLGLFGVVIPPFLFAYGMPKIGATLGSILGSAELPVAVGLSMFVLGERVTVIQWIGVVIIFIGIIFPNLYKRR
ncbi:MULTISPECIES: EamA family transporter [Pontibacillus]|uniref:DMT family transporter n=1 Tax=Pontibacillus chungwhensis TaxID=265426 RepID=A0ABY8UX52_9BACI|nr:MULTISPECIES: DMT family transporter [Pontibacillus]MCD5325070.1 DMT family transporter [Pontibacillus sp. HN14]WIF97321.1 DMT family transporter [Pontibacillus chungwhensis]